MKRLLAIILFLPFFANSQSVLADTVYYPDGGIATKVIQYRNTNVMTGIMLLASKTNVSGAALASTALDYASSVTLATHSPIFCILKFRSGTIGICVARIKTDGGYLIGTTALAGLTATDDIYPMQLTGLVRNTGSISIEITTASLGASAVDCYVYGIKKQ